MTKKRKLGAGAAQTKMSYVLVRYDCEGNLRRPTSVELAEVEGRFPEVSRVWKQTPPAVGTGAVPSSLNWLAECSKALEGLLKDKQCALWFAQPVDPVKLGIPDYPTIITKPMDLGSVKARMASGGYSSPHEFYGDVCLTFDNAMKYNAPSHPVHLAASRLQVCRPCLGRLRGECPPTRGTVRRGPCPPPACALRARAEQGDEAWAAVWERPACSGLGTRSGRGRGRYAGSLTCRRPLRSPGEIQEQGREAPARL